MISSTQTQDIHFNSKKKEFISSFPRISVGARLACVSFKRYTLKCHESGSKLDVLVHSYRGLINPHTHTHHTQQTRHETEKKTV